MREATPALILALVLGGCGSAPSQPDQLRPAAPVSDRAALEHVHGLALEPHDRTLYVATHHGLFRAPEGERRLRRVGTSATDVMGFSIVSPGRFLGSGHPAAGAPGPPNLGLIGSADRGLSWHQLSLSGQADFHVLRAAGRMLYGFDGLQNRLMVSRDSGRSWEASTAPSHVFDLVVDPRDNQHVVVATGEGLFASRDAAKTWRLRNPEVSGALAWLAGGDLFAVVVDDRVLRSRDAGGTFEETGSVLHGGLAALAADGNDLYAGLRDGTIKRSTDRGQTWAVRATAD